MKMKYDNIMLLSDLDGTLLNDDVSISDENKEAINYFVENGGKFGVATGRTHLNALGLINDININIPSIFSNGGVVYDINNKKIIKESIIEIEPKEQLFRYLNDIINQLPNVMIMMYTTNDNFIISDRNKTDKEILQLHIPYKFTSIDKIKDEDFIKILFSGSQEEFKEMESRVSNSKLDEYISCVYSGDMYFEIVKKNISKGTMIKTVLDEIGEKCKVYAVGDYDNDIELIGYADVGIAVDNALDELKEIADIIGVNNNENAIADIIYNKMLLKD